MMRFGIRVLAAAVLASGGTSVAAAQTTIVNFDGLPTSAIDGTLLPAGYGGINWTGNNWFYISCTLVFPCPNPTNDPNTNYPYTPHTFPNMASVSFNLGATMTFGFLGGAKVFNGAWVSTFDGDFFGYILSLNGSVVHTSTLITSNSIPSFAASGYTGLVDRVDIVSSDVGDWVIDDVSYTTTPEPSALLLLAPALAVVGLVARRRRASRTV